MSKGKIGGKFYYISFGKVDSSTWGHFSRRLGIGRFYSKGRNSQSNRCYC